jgi:membrane-bound lytic murein transglycosylase MltF
VDQANEFFGQDFGVAKPVRVEAAPEAPKKGLVQNAMEFFGMDFTAPPPQYRNEAAPKQKNQFDRVFTNLVQAESQGQHLDAKGGLLTSPKGAQGITQLLPATAKDPGYGIAPAKDTSESEYRRVGKDYLKALVTEFNGDYEKALAAYNYGVGNVKKAITKNGDAWKDKLPAETQNYISKILGR